MFALDTAGLTGFRRKTEAFSRRGRPGCSLKANYFAAGELCLPRWGKGDHEVGNEVFL